MARISHFRVFDLGASDIADSDCVQQSQEQPNLVLKDAGSKTDRQPLRFEINEQVSAFTTLHGQLSTQGSACRRLMAMAAGYQPRQY